MPQFAIQLAAPLNNNLLKKPSTIDTGIRLYTVGLDGQCFAITEAEIPKCDMRDKDYRQVYFKFSIIKSVALGSESRMQECLDNLYKLIPYAEEYKDTLHWQ